MVASSTQTAELPTHQLHCMEVWGGNRAVCAGISMAGIDAWICSTPHSDGEGDARGGDIHYASSCGAGKISRFAIADVAGHGEAVAELSTELRDQMRKHINTPDQTKFARALNEAFAALSHDGRFATAILATYFAPTDHLIVVNAGHPLPLWRRAQTGQWQPLHHTCKDCDHQAINLPLGVIDPTAYYQFAVKLSPDDLVLIYTDALIEVRSPDGRMLGADGLLDLVSKVPVTEPATFGPAVLEAVSAYRGDGPIEDDQTLLVLHHNAGEPQKQSLGEKMMVLARMLGLAPVFQEG